MIPSIKRKVTLLAAILSFTLSAATAFGADEPRSIELTRPAALAMAIRNNIDLRVRALDSSLAQTNLQGSRSIYNPNLIASTTYSQTRVAGQHYGTETTSGYLSVSQTLPTGGSVSLAGQTGPTSTVADPLYDYTDWASSVGITIYQPLLKNAGRDAIELGISQDSYAYAGSLESFRDEVIQTVYSVTSEYNRLYVLHQLLESRQEAVRSALQLLEEIKTRPNPGDNPAIEQANAEYALSQRQTDLIEAERQVSSKEATLRYLIGMPRTDHIIPVDPPSRVEPLETEEEAIALALEQRPDLKQKRIQLESNRLREKVSRRNLMPDLAVTAAGGFRGYAQDGGFGDTVDQIGDGKGNYWSTGLLFSLPLGNDLAESEYRRNKLRSEQLQNQITASEWKIRDAIREDNRSLLSARLQVRATARSKSFAEQRVAQYQKNRRLGTASVKDLLDAENDLISARNLELNAIEAFALQVARLWRDIGVLLERQNIYIDTSRPEEVTAGDYPVAPRPAAASAMSTPTAPPAPAVTAAQPPPPPPAATTPAAKPAVTATVPDRKPSVVAPGASYTLKIGEFVASELPAVKKKLAQAGLVPVVTEGGKLEREVVRLLIGNYPNLSAANAALEPFKSLSSPFIIKHAAGSYDAYASSFFHRPDAETEQQRLKRAGAQTTLKQVTVSLPGYLVTAGSFAALADAEQAVAKLGHQQLSAEILSDHTR